MTAEETANVLQTAMDSTAMPKQFSESQSCDVRLGELTVVEGGLTPAVLPSYSTEQLAKLQSEDPVLGRLCERWQAGWEPGQTAPNDELPGLQAWIKEWSNLAERDGVLYRVSRDSVQSSVY